MTTLTLAPPKTKSQALRSYDVADFPALNGREEEWRFTPLKRLRGLATADGSVAVGCRPSMSTGSCHPVSPYPHWSAPTRAWAAC